MSKARRTASSATLRYARVVLPDPEPVLCKLVEDVIAEKKKRDDIKKEVERDPGPRVGPVLSELGRVKAHLSRASKVLQRIASSSGPIRVSAIAKHVESARADVQQKLDFWNSKSPEWLDTEQFLSLRNNLEPRKGGRGNRSFPDYINPLADDAVDKLTGIGYKRSHAADLVAKRLEPLIPLRRASSSKPYRFSRRSLLRRRATSKNTP
ncbi:MAG TPA: hypothetical protein VE008_02470 [Burkholderiales bacterium]|nr:hypothetical protein [Burkholderiales bacterium]